MQTSESTSKITKHPPVFDLRYGYYVTMGGFTVDVDKLHNKLSHVTLTPNGVITLAERGHFLDISPETISDKSKANVITKALICIQVLWMVVQCIARKAAGYPLTLLEIHTMAHVVCALVLYILWWEVGFPDSFSVIVSNEQSCRSHWTSMSPRLLIHQTMKKSWKL